jgi:hypothetical protein
LWTDFKGSHFNEQKFPEWIKNVNIVKHQQRSKIFLTLIWPS